MPTIASEKAQIMQVRTSPRPATVRIAKPTRVVMIRDTRYAPIYLPIIKLIKKDTRDMACAGSRSLNMVLGEELIYRPREQ